MYEHQHLSFSLRFSSVQSALTQQSSELKDTRMLTEFLEKVELEESQYSTLGQVRLDATPGKKTRFIYSVRGVH